ncbi:MAG: FAD-dependent oxidoreductase [Lautropia sp.]
MSRVWHGAEDTWRAVAFLASIPHASDGEPTDALWLLDAAALGAPAVRALRDDERLDAGVRATLVRDWPLACRGLQRIAFGGGRHVLSVGIGLSPRDARGLVQWHEARARRVRDRAVVVGAGLAGLSIAESLARRGWEVDVLERTERPGGVVADIPLLAEHPAATTTDDVRTRLLRAAMLIGRRVDGPRAAASLVCGRTLAADPAAIDRLVAHWPAALMARAAPVPHDGASGAADAPAVRFVRARLLRTRDWIAQVLADPHIRLRRGDCVAALRDDAQGWALLGPRGATLARAHSVFLACQHDALALSGLLDAGPHAVGKMRMIPARVAVGDGNGDGDDDDARRNEQPSIAGGERYRFEWPGRHCVTGPCADPAGLADVRAREPAYRWRLAAPGVRLGFDDSLPMIGRVPDFAAVLAQLERHSRNDRLPWPRRDGLFLMTGLGARGVLWSMLGGECLAATASGEPPLLEPALATALDPARFLRRAIRRRERLLA